jgi:hypothetical protein
VHRAVDGSWLEGHQTHSQFAPCHALDLGTKVNRAKWLRRNALRLRRRLFVAHFALLSANPARLRKVTVRLFMSARRVSHMAPVLLVADSAARV